MNEMYVKVNFANGSMRKNAGGIIVSGDYNSTTIYFEYDRPDGVKMLEIKSPDGTPIFADIIRDGMIVLTGQTEEGDFAPIFTYGGEYIFEVSLWKNDSKLTSARSKLFVEQEAVVLTDDIVQAKMPIFDTLMEEISDAIEEVDNLDINAEKVDNVTTVTINHKDGSSSSVEIFDGEKGEKGDPGEPGPGGFWGTIVGDINSQIDLQEQMATKANIGDIPDVSDFITNSVNNLVNYYLKSETYTKTEVNNLIGAIQQFHYEIVQELPQTGANNILYLVPKATSQTQNVYDEYVYANNTWEKIGDTEIDLSNYVTTTDLNTALASYTTTTDLTTLLAGKQNTIDSSNKLNADYINDTNSTNKLTNAIEKSTWNGKQDALVSGTNIKTINNTSLLGSGNIDTEVIQYSTMPSASATNLGKIVQYTGSTDSTYTQGYFYIAVSDEEPTPTYSWQEISFGGGNEDVPIYRFENTVSIMDSYRYTFTTADKEMLKQVRADVIANKTPIILFNNNSNMSYQFKQPIICGKYWSNATDGKPKLEFRSALQYTTDGGGKNMYYYADASINFDASGEVSSNNFALIQKYLTQRTDIVNVLKEYSGYNATKTQALENINGTLTWVEGAVIPTVITSSTSTYTIASLIGNQTYKLGEITSLTITATTTFDKESIIYFESGTTPTDISIPDTLTNIGDVPTLTTASNVSTGTCDTNKNYIISILNNIAVWKKY